MRVIKIIGIIGLILLAIYLILGIVFGIYTNLECKQMCKSKGTQFYDRIAGGNFDTKDLCLCYFPENKFESFLLN